MNSLSIYGSRDDDEPVNLRKNDKFAGRFKLLKHLGSGGFGQVWQVRDSFLHEEVALKVSRSNIENETLALRCLPKDRYVSIFDYVLDNTLGARAYSMELLRHPWSTLQTYQEDKLSKALNDPVKALDATRMIICIGIDVLKGLRDLHGRKHAKNNRWVHADIKPANLYINQAAIKGVLQRDWDSITPFTKIGDLGLTCELGTVVNAGTMCYAAPEQRSQKKMSPASDIFAVGQTIAFLVTGEPFLSDELAHINRIEAALGARIPSAYLARRLADVLRTMTKASPAQRKDCDHAIGRLTDVLHSQIEWKIASVFMAQGEIGYNLNDAVDISFDRTKHLKGWSNRTPERLDELKQTIKRMYQKGLLRRIGLKYSVAPP